MKASDRAARADTSQVERDEEPFTGEIERRVGRRVQVPYLHGRWSFRKPRKLRPPTTVLTEAEVIDLSVTGALIRATPSPYVVPDIVVGIEFHGHRGRAVVRHVAAGKDGQSEYGIEFLYLDPQLRELVYRAVTQADRRLEWHWAIAR